MLPQDLVKYKNESKQIIALTAWDSITGSLAEEAGADIILIGDSLAMVALGHETTLPVTVIVTGFNSSPPDNNQNLRRRISGVTNSPFYNISDNKEGGANIPEFLRLRQNKRSDN